jgi:putative lipoprotein
VASVPPWVALQLVALSLVACGHVAADARVTGSVTYRQRIALSPAAIVQVQLVDVSRADAAAVVLAEQTIRPEHQVPIPFELVYDRSRIDPAHRYGVQARITDGDRLAFMNDGALPVITHGAPTTVEVVVRPVAGP